jgi:uncharacterized protein YegL
MARINVLDQLRGVTDMTTFAAAPSMRRLFKSMDKLLAVAVVAGLFGAGAAQAAGSVSWTSPPNGSSFPVGTVVHPEGIASGTGTTGGGGLDLVLVLDGSGSMSASTLATQANAANALIAAVPQASTNIAVVRFGNVIETKAPLQPATNQAALMAAVNSIVDSGGTPTAEAITFGAALINADNGRSKQMVVISDGGPASQSAAEAAATAANTGTPSIQVNTVGIPGTNFGNQEDIAIAGGGTFVTATDPQALIDIFNGTAGNLVAIKQVDVTLPDGTVLLDIGLTSGIGTFKVMENWALQAGANTWTVLTTFTDDSTASASLTVFGVDGQIPLPAAGWLLLAGIGGLGLMSRRRRS